MNSKPSFPVEEAAIPPSEMSKRPEVSGGTVLAEKDEALNRNPFLDPKVANFYRDLYERTRYECRHEFDPELEWTQAEERKLVWKLDWHVCTWACVMFFALQVDRGNLSQAVSDNMLEQLGLSTNEFNYGMFQST